MLILLEQFIKLFFLYSMIFHAVFIFSRPEKPKIEQLKIGNLALPSSQEPGPLIGFGQNMLDQGNLQLFCYVDYLNGYNKNFTTIMPELLYGIRDNFSILIELPIAVSFDLNDETYQGLQDLLVQLEYAVFDQAKNDATNQITLVGNVSFPTGAQPGIHQQNFGSASFHAITFFLGTTISHMDEIWYPFISTGAQITTANNQQTKLGNQILYQAGLSRNIHAQADKYIFNVTIECDGRYKEKNKTNGVIDANSGGHQILLGPSLWFSTLHATFQAGISWVIYEVLNGTQNKNNYYISAVLGYKF